MSSILEIDFDHFNLIDKLGERLEALFYSAECLNMVIEEEHYNVLLKWKNPVRRGILKEPLNILHVDEHHDLMAEIRTHNIANFV